MKLYIDESDTQKKKKKKKKNNKSKVNKKDFGLSENARVVME